MDWCRSKEESTLGVVQQAATLQQGHDALGGRLDYLLNVLVR